MEEYLVTYRVRFPQNAHGIDWPAELNSEVFDTTLKTYLRDPELLYHSRQAGMPDYGVELGDMTTVGYRDVERGRIRDFGVRHLARFSDLGSNRMKKDERLGHFLSELMGIPQSDGDWNLIGLAVDRP